MSRAKHWMFTLNNPDVESDYQIRDLPYKYCIYSYELASSGTVHIQGYVSFATQMRLGVLTKLLPGAHFEVRRGTHQQAKKYCSKTEDVTHLDGPYEFGDDSDISNGPRERTDLNEIKAKIDSGATMTTLWQENFGITARYYKAFETYFDVKSKHREYKDGEKPKIVIMWGPSGTGKSTRARKDYPGAYWLTKPSQNTSTVWWQGYSGEEVVVFDEFYGWIPYDLLLRILDFYQVTVEKKGSSAKLAAKTFIFTSNKHPDEWYPKVKDTTALKRRIREFGTIEYLGENFNESTEQDNQ